MYPAVIYKDIVTGDELLTDAFDVNTVDDFFYEVDGKMIAQGGEDIDIGGNAAEGEEEEAGEIQQVCNVVSSGRFQETNFGKKDYVAVYKAYMKVRFQLRQRRLRAALVFLHVLCRRALTNDESLCRQHNR